MLKRKGKVDPEESVEIQETSKMITPQTNTPQTNTPQKSIAANQENSNICHRFQQDLTKEFR